MKVQADIQGHYDGGSVGSDGGALCQHLKKKKMMMKRERMTVMIVELVSYYYLWISMRLH